MIVSCQIYLAPTTLSTDGTMHLQLVLLSPIQRSKKLAEKIRHEQSKFEVDIAQLLQDQQPKPKKACYRKLDERIACLVADYNPTQISEYLKNIAVNVSL